MKNFYKLNAMLRIAGITALVAVIGFVAVSCGNWFGGDDNDEDTSGDSGIDRPNPNPGPDTGGSNNNVTIYVSGSYYYYDSGGWYSTACYWVNGARTTPLPIPNGTKYCYTTDIAVQDGKVYVSGNYNTNSDWNNFTACYWVNGQRTDLPVPNGTRGDATGITVQGSNVYISGFYYDSNGNYTACYWVNGTRTDLPIPPKSETYDYRCATLGIAVQDGKVYVSGSYVYSKPHPNYEYHLKGCYWVDGIRTDLPEDIGREGFSGMPRITVYDGKVYVSGNYYDNDNNLTPCYWVNGDRKDLPVPDGIEGWATDIVVQDGKVYISGIYTDSDWNNLTACYWVNGQRTDLQLPGSSSDEHIRITVYSGKVYISDVYTDSDWNNSTAYYWVDGKRTDLPVPSGMNGSATGIAVVSQ
jgi:hypothetical protein